MKAVVFRHVDELVPYARNARTHSAEQVARIAGSIAEFGFAAPVLADDRGIVAGHGRVLAARRLYESGKALRLPSGEEIPSGTVPVVDVTGWSDAQRRAYILADNRLAEQAGWDEELLRIEIQELGDVGFDVELTGFSLDDVDSILSGDWEEDGAGRGAERKLDPVKYTAKLATPIYEIKDKRPAIAELYDATKANEILARIAQADGLTEEVRAFLVAAAGRHVRFDYEAIAEFYAHAAPEVQALMRDSALVIIDYESAIEGGYVRLTKKILELSGENDHLHEAER